MRTCVHFEDKCLFQKKTLIFYILKSLLLDISHPNIALDIILSDKSERHISKTKQSQLKLFIPHLLDINTRLFGLNNIVTGTFNDLKMLTQRKTNRLWMPHS